ncbi:MAG: SUMF1/EgtB/PvdO family nonheme iron enzyme [Tenuifilaceae bacterium]|nr:SUMF1/EgtB/PvdO family nonheme iron enzyme [Tenuifilaceae bacterium]
MLIFSRDTLRTQVEAATGGHITVLYDDKGYPSHMRVIPKFRYEDLGLDSALGTGVCTAFLRNGQELSELLYGVYPATVFDGRAVSLPGRDPRASIAYDAAKAACTAKGPGWHLATVHEWAAMALWCKANGFEPRGNTNYGRAHDAPHEVAVRPDRRSPGDATGAGRTATGGGPASWRHDGGLSGIADMVGNVWEWQDLLRLEDGRIFTTPDNTYDTPESSWVAQGHWFSDEGAVQLKNSAGVVSATSRSVAWKDTAKAPGYTESQLLQRLLISPHADTGLAGTLYVVTEGQRFPYRGGSFYDGSNAGLGALVLNSPRSSSHTSIGFRPAFAS